MASNGTTLPVKTTIKNFYNTNTKRLEVNLANGTISSAYTTAQMYHEPNQLDLLKMSVDPTKVLSSNIKEVRNKNIPLIYIGILPVPQLNPSVATTNFQNSCAYWSVKADMICEIDSNSIFTQQKDIYSGPDDVYLRLSSANAHECDWTQVRPLNLNTYGN
ncbi:hypothetical protein QE152_g36590 [Popillia japonica]|uniref:Uncharacterized protein n=1 Tax=Popillia japonica TaxID=7064 RepID=A0AAW1ID03_POPJA